MPLLSSDLELRDSSGMGSDAFETSLDHSVARNSPLKAAIFKRLQYKCVVDILPGPFQAILISGKYFSIAFVVLNICILLLWLPFWLVSFLMSEWGVYALGIVSVFFLGRCIIRFIAFPGASPKMTGDIEREFTKYSVRMLEAGVQSFVDVASVLARSEAAAQKNGLQAYELPALWSRATKFRNRVLAVYLEVLQYIYQQPCESSSASSEAFTRYGNNKLRGDIGNLNRVTVSRRSHVVPDKENLYLTLFQPEARTAGGELIEKLKVLLALIDALEGQAKSVLQSKRGSTASLTPEAKQVASHLLGTSREILDFVSSLKPPSDEQDQALANEDQAADALRRQVERQSTMEMVGGTLSSILPMLDPPPANSIFSFDMQRGCMLSRYRGARQFWVRRPQGGMLDVLHFPSSKWDASTPLNPRAVLYCNPNAGLIEVAAGMSLVGGNVPSSVSETNATDETWVDFYISLGIDVYIFNYAGYGRSHGNTSCVKGLKNNEFHPGMLARIKRIISSSFFAFQPRPETLREDGLAVAQYLINDVGISQLIIHGESIGGVAASSTARMISESPTLRGKLSLLLCDRTFCNLEAVSQRLVGGWAGNAIRILAPFWSTNVTNDFLAAHCRKVVANDAGDLIISDPSSLKSGIALWKEIHRGASVSATNGIGWITQAPLQYRMSDLEDLCVCDPRYAGSGGLLPHARAPEWPRDHYITIEEAFHFAACVKRIGKQAKVASKSGLSLPVYDAWVLLSCMDGLCGDPLGVPVKRGFDATVTWLCCLLVFGPQIVAARAAHRIGHLSPEEAELEDFDARPDNFLELEKEGALFPKPLPVVLSAVKNLDLTDPSLSTLTQEIQFIVGVLEYCQSRVMASTVIETAADRQRLVVGEVNDVGCFMNLHCGHNNAFSTEERQKYRQILQMATADEETSIA